MGDAETDPIGGPITIFNHGDCERVFGRLEYDHPISHAVQDFFLNGGSEVIVVCVVKQR